MDRKKKNLREQAIKRERIKRNIKEKERQALGNLQEAPESIRKKGDEVSDNIKAQVDSIGYAPIHKEAPKYVFRDVLEGLGNITDINEYDKNIKEQEQRRI